MASNHPSLTDQPVNAWAQAQEKEYPHMVSKKQRKARISILGLALTAMLALGALSAGAAQASTWNIDGKAFLGTETFEAEASSTFSFSLFGGAKFTCAQESSTGSISGGSTGNAVFSFTGCEDADGVCGLAPFTTQKTKISLVSAGGVLYEKFVPASGPYFGEITVTGPECVLSGRWPLSGSFAGALGAEAEGPVLSFTAAAQKATGSALKFAGSAATLTGSQQQWLNGAYAGYAWGAS